MFNIFKKLKTNRQIRHDEFQKQVTEAYALINTLSKSKDQFAKELKRRTVKTFKGLPVVAWSAALLADDAIPLEVPAAKYSREHKCIFISDTALVVIDTTMLTTLLTHQYHVSQLNDRTMSWDEIIFEADRRTIIDGQPLTKLLMKSIVSIKKAEIKYSVNYGFTGFLTKRINKLMHA